MSLGKGSSGRTAGLHELAVLVSWGLLVALASCASLFVVSDQALQLKAFQQYRERESPSPNHLVTADPADLSRPTVAWISWWPPGTQIAVWPLAATGLPLAVALRWVAGLGVLAGSLGWARWWRRFELPEGLTLAAAILLPWLRYPSNALFQYSAEILAFATLPWVLLAAHSLVERLEGGERIPVWRAAAFGFFAGALFWVKYSAIFVPVALLLFLALELRRRRAALVRVAVPLLAAFAAPILTLTLLNEILSGVANMLTASHVWNVSPLPLLYAVANPGLMAADLGSLLQWIFTNPAHGLWRDPMVVVACGIPGGLTLAALLARGRRPAERLAAFVLGATLVLMVAAWVGSPAVSFEPRHVAGAAMASVPAVLAVALRGWPAFRPLARGWLAVAAAVYLAAPAAYGPAAALVKAWRASGYRAAGSGFYNPLVSATDAGGAVAGLRAGCRVRPAVWYVPDPLTALDLPDPLLITHADFEPLEQLAAARYSGPASVCALLPPRFEGNGKGPAIRASFTDVKRWQRLRVPGAAYDLWVGSGAVSSPAGRAAALAGAPDQPLELSRHAARH